MEIVSQFFEFFVGLAVGLVIGRAGLHELIRHHL